MTPAAEFPAAPSRWRWLDRWCELPWRALLTWGALAALSGWASDHGMLRMMVQVSVFLLELEDKASPTLSAISSRVILPVNTFILLVWFEPFVLRLNLVRGLAWLGLRLLILVSVDFYAVHTPDATALVLFSFALLAWSVLAVPVLHPLRSRPWWSVGGGVLMALTYYTLFKAGASFDPAHLCAGLAYAAVFLFGTTRRQQENAIREPE